MEHRKKSLIHNRKTDAARAADEARRALQTEARTKAQEVSETPEAKERPVEKRTVPHRKPSVPKETAAKTQTPSKVHKPAKKRVTVETVPAEKPKIEKTGATEAAKEVKEAKKTTVTESAATVVPEEKSPVMEPVKTPETEKKKTAKEEKAEKKKADADKKKQERAKKDEEKKKKKAEKKASGKVSFAGRVWNSFGNGAAAVVSWHDRAQAVSDVFFGDMGFGIAKEYHDMRVRYKGTSRRMMRGFFGLALVTCMLLLVFEHFTVYEYAYNGRILGYVKSQDAVTNILGVAGEKLSGENNINIKFKANDNVTMKKVASSGKDVDDADQVLNKLTYMTDVEVDASGIYENGKLVAVLENESTAKSVLQKVLKHYSTPDTGMQVVKAGFKKNVEIRTVRVMITSVQSADDASASLENGGTLKVSHIVNDGETMSSIAKDYSVSQDKIVDSKTGQQVKNVESGEMVTMQKTVDKVIVKLVESGSMTEAVPFKTVKVKDSKLYVGDSYVKQAGVDGRQKITGKITKENGKETSRDIKKTEVITKSVNEILLIGTSTKPKTAPTGNFAYPIRTYTITSYFGSRWGRLHEGIDFAASTGTPIYASDGGTVTIAGTYSAYGNCVEINHGSGKETRYGHCSKILVSVGDKVYQGQEIALVGSTGRSTGPHLHFEIRIDGTAVNPLPYLK